MFQTVGLSHHWLDPIGLSPPTIQQISSRSVNRPVHKLEIVFTCAYFSQVVSIAQTREKFLLLSFQLSSHVCDSYESCSHHCFSSRCLVRSSCIVSTCLFTAVPGAASASLVQVPCVVILAPDSQRPRVASRKHCRCKAAVCVRVFLSRSSRRDSFRRCSLSTHLDFSRRGLLLLVDAHYRLISTSRRGSLLLVDAPCRLISTFPSRL